LSFINAVYHHYNDSVMHNGNGKRKDKS
jgi:hypothetical protein